MHIINLENITIRPAKVTDSKRLVEIKRQSWVQTYPNQEIGLTKEIIDQRFVQTTEKSLAKWQNYLKDIGPDDQVFVAVHESKIIGFSGIQKRDNIGEIKTIYLDPTFTSKGIGSLLLKADLDWLKSCSKVILYVTSYNYKAINFYKKFGFETMSEFVEPFAFNGFDLPQTKMELTVNLK